MKHRIVLLLALALAGSETEANAGSLRDALVPARARSAPVIRNAIQPLAKVIGSQVAKQIPTLSTSAGYTFEFNLATDVYERSATTFGPIFTERAVTIGKRKFNVNLSYSYIRFDSYNGRDIDRLRSRSEVANVRDVPDTEGPVPLFVGISDIDEYLTQLDLDLDLEAQLFELSFTYGLLDYLDLNIVVPIVRTYARSELHDTTPDPRCVRAGVPQCAAIFGVPPDQIPLELPIPSGSFDPSSGFYERDSAGFASATGIGDVHLRAKYLALRQPVGVAGLLDLTLPTGDQGDFHGSGDTALLPLLILSHDVIGLLEVHGQAGVNMTLNEIERSEGRYAIGVTGQPFDFLALSVDFLGRSEFESQGRIARTGRLPAVKDGEYVQGFPELLEQFEGDGAFTGRPYFIDIDRNDILELSIGLKLALADRALVFANFLVPLNDDGLRADFVPTVGVEATF